MTSAPTRMQWRDRARDLAVVVGGCGLDLVGFSQVFSGAEAFPAWVAGYAAAGFVALFWRRRAPRVVFAVMWLHAVIAAVAIPSYGPVVGLMIALFAVANRSSRAAGIWALALSLVPTVILTAGEVAGSPPELVLSVLVASLTLLSLVNAGAWSLGRWARAHHERLDLLERQRRREAQDALAAERARIARDLHDIVSHSVGVMTLQAAGARRVLAAGKQDRAAQALADIEGAGTQAMTELRRMLGVLRVDGRPDDDGSGDADEPETQPRVGLDELEPLVQRVLAAGVPARVVRHGRPRALDLGADLTAYRIVQEALTNVLKHADVGVPTVVELRWGGSELELSITNDAPTGPVEPRPASGYGLIGLHERVAAVGGHFAAGPLPDGGFRVAATLPAAVPAPAVATAERA
ncbi:sensor histidine kinase [Pseudonocardia hierapolitana]|nr:histidine kinase [Pseudonocardia hierapolitana]